MTATSLVPPPTSTTIRPTGSAIGTPAPIAAAIDSSMRGTCRAPADSAASSTARRSTSVMPDGAHTTRRGCARRRSRTFAMKWRSIFSVTSKSAITPWRSGRVAEIVAGVRPIIRWASAPTAWTSPVRSSIATTDGSDRTIPRPRTWTTVFAVPRSIAMSRTDRSDQAADRRPSCPPSVLGAIPLQGARADRPAASPALQPGAQRVGTEVVEQPDGTGRRAVVEHDRAARPVRVRCLRPVQEQRLVRPGAGVRHQRPPAGAAPAARVVAGQRAEAMDVAEDDVLGADAQAVDDARERREARVAHLGAEQPGDQRGQPEPQPAAGRQAGHRGGAQQLGDVVRRGGERT